MSETSPKYPDLLPPRLAGGRKGTVGGGGDYPAGVRVFHVKPLEVDHGRAVDIMLTVHNRGVAVVGVYPFEVAETKVTQVMDCARSNQHPLQCTMEKE